MSEELRNWVREANESMREGRYHQALALFDGLVAQQPRNHWHRLNAITACLKAGRADEARFRHEKIDNSAQLGAAVLETTSSMIDGALRHEPVQPRRMKAVSDYWSLRVAGKRLAPLRRIDVAKKFPSGFNFELEMPAHVGLVNDYRFISDAVSRLRGCGVPFHRGQVLLIGRVSQPEHLVWWQTAWQERIALWTGASLMVVGESFEVPGDAFPPSVQVVNVAADEGYAAVNAALTSRDDVETLAFVHADDALTEVGIRYLQELYAVTDMVLAVQPGTADVKETGQEGALAVLKGKVDWTKELYGFRKVGAWNLVADRQRFLKVGGFQEDIRSSEIAFKDLGYRLYLDGAYFLPAPWVRFEAPKQTKEGSERLEDHCATNWHRKKEGVYKVPKVSVYIPSYNNGRYIVEAVRSVLDQDYPDLEVCVFDDGSPDDTLARLQEHFGEDPRVRVFAGKNGGIGYASNNALRQARGLYIGQLDSDDRLKPGAVRRLVEYLDENRTIVCAYTSCERVDADGNYLQPEYSFPVFSRERMLTTSIAHHFRMFRKQAWSRTSGFREDILNAVDYDMFLKMSEVGPFHHIEEVFYQRRWHGNNTSMVNEGTQTKNTPLVQGWSLKRMGLAAHWMPHAPDPDQPRKITYVRRQPTTRVFFWPDYSRANPYQKLLYESLDRPDFDVLSGDIRAATKALSDRPNDGPVVFHLHWLNAIADFNDEEEALKLKLYEFKKAISTFKKKGGKLVWTIHNALSHETRHVGIERGFMKWLCEQADRVHLHSAASAQEINGKSFVPMEKLHVARHGSYVGHYPLTVSVEEARSYFGLGVDECVFCFTGQIRAYKGLEALLDAWSQVARNQPVRLLIGGEAKYDLATEIEKRVPADLRDKVVYHAGFVDDAFLQYFYRAADVAVYPYSRILTSGSALLGLSMGLPVILPEVGMTKELLEGNEAGWLFNPSQSGSLEAALADVLKGWQQDRLVVRKQAALQRAHETRWDDLSALFAFE